MTERDGWYPIETAPEAEPILVFCPKAHRGRDSCEVVVVCVDEQDNAMSFWTNGGPNGGSDFHFNPEEMPTHWRRLPEPPNSGETR